ncbi:MAG: hypothetical protein GY906_35065, partial [bacterium]|nr:hypothetical protein [bacterium]
MAHRLQRFERRWTGPLFRFVLANHAMSFAFLVITYVTPKLVQSGSRDFRIDLGMVFALVLVPLMALCIYFFLAFT